MLRNVFRRSADKVVYRLQFWSSKSARCCSTDTTMTNYAAENQTDKTETQTKESKEAKLGRVKSEKILSTVYSDSERKLILDRFNNDSEDELCKIKYLKIKIAKAIVEHREKHGPFDDITNLIDLPGIGEKSLQFFCTDIVNKDKKGPTTKQIKTNNKQNFFAMKPDLPRERLESLQSVVSIDLGFKTIAWIHMNRNMEVHDWKSHTVDVMPKRYDPISYVENVSSVVEDMPFADLYLMEYITFRKKNLNLLPALLHIRTLEGILYGMLNRHYPDTHEHKVVTVGRMTVGRHFDLIVGSNRKSGQHIATSLVEMAATHRKPRVIIPPPLIKMFLSTSQLEKEYLSNCLLQAIAFYELAINNISEE
ncbi:transcription elongation factor, mitochondrial-like [Ptychodera flava]|uniref:transcription elongation factor, mitochondrial-like n=1 Tax=Ptychodera flava TaxID=63121 RepID=UPI00396AA9C9